MSDDVAIADTVRRLMPPLPAHLVWMAFLSMEDPAPHNKTQHLINRVNRAWEADNAPVCGLEIGHEYVTVKLSEDEISSFNIVDCEDCLIKLHTLRTAFDEV